jgi:hypothetical protein
VSKSPNQRAARAICTCERRQRSKMLAIIHGQR